MPDNNTLNFLEAQRKKHKQKGWIQAEIEAAAERELAEFSEITKHEPNNLTSGNMDNIVQGKDHEEPRE